MRKLTIQQKIILWFSATLIIIIALISVLTFSIADLVLDKNIKERLMSVVSTNVEEIEFLSELDNIEREKGDQFLAYRDGWLEIDDDFCDYFEGICTALYDENGELLYGEAPVRTPTHEGAVYGSVSNIKYNGDKYYVYDKKIDGEDFEGLWLRGIVSYKESTNILYNVVRLSFWLLPVLAMLAILGGYIITRRSFLPVQQLAESAEEIGKSGDLSKRINIGDGKDELHMLADTFNNMFDRLERNFEAERSFTSDASHELRTPTAVIMAQAQYALELADSEDEYHESLEVIKKQAEQMNSIINQLLFFTRLEQGTEPVERQLTDMSSLTEAICSEQQLLAINDIRLSYRIDEDIYALLDCSLYTRMLNNLISNAYKYGKPYGTVNVSLKKSENAAELRVEDDGIGISAENLEKIWLRFYQVESSRSQNTEGSTGLGLAMVKQIVNLLGGKITVESKEGEGTAFTFTIPLSDNKPT